MKEGVRFIGDILTEVSEEENLSKEEIKEIFRIHRKYLLQLMDDPNVLVIKLPYLGNLYFNARYFNLLYSRAKKKELYKKEKEKSLKVIEEVNKDKNRNIKTRYDYPQYSRTTLIKLVRAIKRYLGISHKKTKGKKENIEFLENYSLGLLKKES